MIDSHAHLDSPRYDEDRHAMLERAHAAGVEAILSIGIGDGAATMHRAADLAGQYEGRAGVPRIFATAGVHPHDASQWNDAVSEDLKRLLERGHMLAVGEIGLDYFYDNSPREQQREVFAAQMRIAAEAGLPIIIHCRPSQDSTNAWDDTLSVLETGWARYNLGGVLHCFTGTLEHAQRALAIGFMISFATNITFPKAADIRAVSAAIPEDHFLIETDAPFLAPVPFRGKRNEPAYVVRAAETIAAERRTTPEHIRAVTTENFYRFFSRAREVA